MLLPHKPNKKRVSSNLARKKEAESGYWRQKENRSELYSYPTPLCRRRR
jgi:hypothetical protein